MELKIVLQKRNDEKPKKPAALAGFGINEAAPDSYCGLFEWVSYRVLEKVGLNPKKPFSFLNDFWNKRAGSRLLSVAARMGDGFIAKKSIKPKSLSVS